MSEPLIKRKALWSRLNNVKHSDWCKVAEDRGLLMTKPNGGTSHTLTIRDPKKDPGDPSGVIATAQVNLHKVANEQIFKRLRRFGVIEDDIWRSLGLLKENRPKKAIH